MSTRRTRPGTSNLPGLIWTLVRTDFKTRYHGSLGGLVWALLKPLVMFSVLWGVFSFVFASAPGYSALNLIIGLFFYDFFSEASKAGLAALRVKGYLLTKAKFSPWILVLTSMVNSLITLMIFAIATVVALVMVGHAPGMLALASFLFCLACLLAIVFGLSLATSVLFLRYQDLNQVWEVVTQAGFFVAPIIYPIGVLPHRFHLATYLWSPTPVIMFSRSALLQSDVQSPFAHGCLAFEAVLVVGIGAAIYHRLAPSAAEYL